ncbi:unnamed protein product, partial [Mesorhabditis spiculigera]
MRPKASFLVAQHRHFCTRAPSLPFVCDLHETLTGLQLKGAEEAAHRYRESLYVRNNSALAVIVGKLLGVPSRNIEQPWRASDVYEKEEMACLHTSQCLTQDMINGFIVNSKAFLKIWVWKLYQRWFPNTSETCQSGDTPNVMILILIDGIANDARKIPYVKVYSENKALSNYLKNVEIEIFNSLVQNWEMPRVLEHLIDDLGYYMREFNLHGGEHKDHSVPEWARQLFILCAALVVFALIIEWYVVRRKLAIKKSASGIKITVGKSKTHMMF